MEGYGGGEDWAKCIKRVPVYSLSVVSLIPYCMIPDTIPSCLRPGLPCPDGSRFIGVDFGWPNDTIVDILNSKLERRGGRTIFTII